MTKKSNRSPSYRDIRDDFDSDEKFERFIQRAEEDALTSRCPYEDYSPSIDDPILKMRAQIDSASLIVLSLIGLFLWMCSQYV